MPLYDLFSSTFIQPNIDCAIMHANSHIAMTHIVILCTLIATYEDIHTWIGLAYIGYTRLLLVPVVDAPHEW